MNIRKLYLMKAVMTACIVASPVLLNQVQARDGVPVPLPDLNAIEVLAQTKEDIANLLKARLEIDTNVTIKDNAENIKNIFLADINLVKTKLSDINEIKAFQVEIDRLRNDLTTESAAKDLFEAKVKQLETKIENITNEKKLIEADLIKVVDEKKLVEDEKKLVEEERTKLNKLIDDGNYDAKYNAAKANVENKEKEIETLKKKIVDLGTILKDLEAITELRKIKKEKIKELEELTKQFDDLNGILANADNEAKKDTVIVNLANELASTTKILKNMEKRTATSTITIDLAKEKIRDLEQSYKSAYDNKVLNIVGGKAEELNSLKISFENANGEVDKLSKQIAEISARLITAGCKKEEVNEPSLASETTDGSGYDIKIGELITNCKENTRICEDNLSLAEKNLVDLEGALQSALEEKNLHSADYARNIEEEVEILREGSKLFEEKMAKLQAEIDDLRKNDVEIDKKIVEVKEEVKEEVKGKIEEEVKVKVGEKIEEIKSLSPEDTKISKTPITETTKLAGLSFSPSNISKITKRPATVIKELTTEVSTTTTSPTIETSTIPTTTKITPTST
ncbi:MAG: hypothetical protein LBP31_02090, partial [Holosporales bacterium]|nr:hypothetical protein [Holosporales bacterium]